MEGIKIISTFRKFQKNVPMHHPSIQKSLHYHACITRFDLPGGTLELLSRLAQIWCINYGVLLIWVRNCRHQSCQNNCCPPLWYWDHNKERERSNEISKQNDITHHLKLRCLTNFLTNSQSLGPNNYEFPNLNFPRKLKK